MLIQFNFKNYKAFRDDTGLDAKLHPLLLKYILTMFHSEESNRKGAQLIYTAHDNYTHGAIPMLNPIELWGDDYMNISLLRTDTVYRKMINAPKEKRDDIYRYEIAKPFEAKWAYINVPIKASQKGGYDVVII